MPTSLDIQADGRLLRFYDNFKLDEIAPDQSVARSTVWETDSSDKLNEISFQFPGETTTSLAVEYAFNENNQLTITVPAQHGVPAASAVWTLRGQIFIKDVSGVEYALIDDAGKPLVDENDPATLKERIYIYATLEFNGDHTALQVEFADKTTTDITGVGLASDNLATEEYSAGGDLTSDLLAFHAVTTNSVNGKDRDFVADIKFFGRWDMHENSLVFATSYDNTGATPVGYIALGGEIGGTNFGLLVKQDGEVVLEIAGKYAWNKNTLGWDLGIGYSKAAGLEARFKAGGTIQGKNGKLTFDGSATLKKGAQGMDLDLSLDLTYTTASKNIVFTLTSDNGSYEVKLSGDFTIKGTKVSMVISATNKDGKPSIKGSIELGFYKNNASLKAALEAILTPNGLKLTVDMQFSFYWGPSGVVAALP